MNGTSKGSRATATGEERSPRRTAFGLQVRDALAHLHDLPYLQSHPLAQPLRRQAGMRPAAIGQALQKRLLEAIERLRPGAGLPAAARVSRRYQLLTLRYAEGMEPEEVWRQLGISKSEFYREEGLGLDAITADLLSGVGQEESTPPPAVPPSQTPNNLPAPPTLLVGREREVTELAALLVRQDVRLLTLTGTGGVGKTRLGLQAAAGMLDRFPDGVYFVPLAPVSNPALVASTIAQALGLQDTAGRPPLDALKEFVRDRRLLLVLDNFEHLLPAASLVADLLAAGPRVKALVTSRAVLRLRGEHEFAVAPLGLPNVRRLPPPELLTDYPAVSLFVQRAQAVRPGFAVTAENAAAIAEICARLDGLPLAIELAAARIKLLPPQPLLARLERRLPLLTGGARDLPARHQTLRGTLEWSYDLLDAEEQQLFRRLAVFVGGAALSAAEAVCAAEGEPQQGVLDGLAVLVDNSLMQLDDQGEGEPRFTMLETVREYARERLEQSGEVEPFRARHVAHYAALAEEGERSLQSSQQALWLAQLERDHDNFREALEHCRQREELREEGLRLAGRLGRFWRLRGHFTEGRRWLNELLNATQTATPAARASALYWAGLLAYYQADYDDAAEQLTQGGECYRQAGDSVGAADVMQVLGNIAMRRSELSLAKDRFEDSLRVFQQAGDENKVASVYVNLGVVEEKLENYAAARRLYLQALPIKQRLGDEIVLGMIYHNLGVLAMYDGDAVSAIGYQRQAIAVARRLGDRHAIATGLAELGNLVRRQGDHEEAAQCYRDALVLAHEVSDRARIPECLEGLAHLAVAAGQPARAARLLAAAEVMRTATGSRLPPMRRADCEHTTNLACAALGESAFAAAWAEGQTLPPAEVLRYALEENTSP